jgi:hypothetical protein
MTASSFTNPEKAGKIPLNPPFLKGEVALPLIKGGGEGFKKAIFKEILT